ncbi:hypothetical protein VVE59_32025, partial [Pseudomonas aeruginosa]
VQNPDKLPVFTDDKKRNFPVFLCHSRFNGPDRRFRHFNFNLPDFRITVNPLFAASFLIRVKEEKEPGGALPEKGT